MSATEKEAEYRRNAAEAQRQALRAKNADEKAAWLRLVQGWLTLLPKKREDGPLITS